MDRTRILEKIQKCFNLSKSSNPGEAANALRQAQKMMELHGVSERELGAVGIGNEKVSLPVQVNKKVPLWLLHLSALIKKAFGVKTVIEHEVRVSDASYAFRYFGPEDRVMLAGYTTTVIYRELNRQWAQHLKDHPYLKGDRGARSGFFIGWLQTVEQTVIEFGMTDNELAGTELVKNAHYDTLVKSKASNLKVLGSTLGAGSSAGADFRLHKPITPDRLKIGAK